jgi:hypothetical protein
LQEKIAAPVYKAENTAVGSVVLTPQCPLQMLALTSPTSGGRSVGIVQSRTEGHRVCFVCLFDALSPLLFNCALKYAIFTVHDHQVELKLNGAHQLLAYADDVNLLVDDIDTINKTYKL